MNFLDYLFGRCCLFCGRTVDPRSMGVCRACAEALEDGGLVIPMEECQPAVSLFRYKGPVRQGLHRFKYQGYAALGIRCGHLLAERFRALDAQAHVVTCVPRAGDGMLRMYNQSQVIARRFARDLGLPLDGKLLRKRNGAKRQPECRDRHERIRNAEFAYRKGPSPRSLTGLTVVLIDDLYTTGATVRACEKVLKKRGAARVLIYTAMRGVPNTRRLVPSHAFKHRHYSLADETGYRNRRYRTPATLRLPAQTEGGKPPVGVER